MATFIYAGEGGSITHSVSQANLVSLSITAPLTNGNSTIMAFDGQETIILTIKDASGASEDNVSPPMSSYGNGTWSVSDVDVSALVNAGITSIKYTANITYGPLLTPNSMIGDLASFVDTAQVIVDQLTAGPVVVGPAAKAVVSDFAATFAAGTNTLSSVTIPYTQVVEFYDSSDELGNTFPADNVVPITLVAVSADAGPLDIPLTFVDGVGYGLSGTVDATALGSPITFTITMGQDTAPVHTSLVSDPYAISVQEEQVDPPVESPTGPTITLNHLFTPSAGQTYTYSILGETPGTITADERIVLNVPQAQMNKVLAYASNWDYGLTGSEGSQAIPDVALLLNTVTGSWFNALTMGLTGATQGTSYAYSSTFGYVQGDESSNCKTLLYQFQNIAGFTYTTPGVDGESNVLDSIPREAIKSFTSGPVTTAPLGGVVGDTVVPGSSAQSAEYAGLSGAIQSLFEQAVNAGLVTSEVQGALLNDTVLTGVTGTPTLETALGTTGSVYGAQWAPGQSLGIYVQFQMQKNRRYQLATLPSFGGSTSNQALEIAFGGVTFTVNPSVVETSGSTPVTYEIILNTIA